MLKLKNTNYISEDPVKPPERASSQGAGGGGIFFLIPPLYSVPLLTNSVSFKRTNTITREDIFHVASQGLFTGFEPPKEETKHSRHFSSKRQADEWMENTDQSGCADDAPASASEKRQKRHQKNRKKLPALTLRSLAAGFPLHPSPDLPWRT